LEGSLKGVQSSKIDSRNRTGYHRI
jgi:hypothetical protein